MTDEEVRKVLDYWLCIEALTPQKVNDERTDKSSRTTHVVTDGKLPWFDPRFPKAPFGKEWRHQISFGLVDMKGLMPLLNKLLGVSGGACP
jgi:hypothetical protein